MAGLEGYVAMGTFSDERAMVANGGFLGAGTIIRSGASVMGLTTAASIWAVAGIGLAVGCGYYLGALTCTFIILTTLLVLRKVETKVPGTKD